MPDRPASPRRDLALGLPAAAVAGLLVGVLGTFKYQYGVSVASGAGFPTGLVLALAMVAVFVLALRLAFPSRWFAVAAAAGITSAVLILSMKGPGGSVVVLSGVLGTVWVDGAVALAVIVVALPPLRWWSRNRRPTDGILVGDPTVDASAPIRSTPAGIQPDRSVHDPLGEDRQ